MGKGQGRSKVFKALVGIVTVVALVAVGLVIYVQLNWDRTYDVPLPQLKVTDDPEVIARGKYLVHGPAHCSNCHVGSLEQMRRADNGEDLPLAGGAVFPMGPVGKIAVPNLTPDPTTGLGRYSDGQVFRMLRHSVRPNGTASLSLIMPFQRMADEDHVAIVSYLRSLDPIEREVPPSSYTFFGKAIRVFAPPFQPVLEPEFPSRAPPMEATAERGEYLARYVANCYTCHTAHDPATFERIGPEFGGGMEFEPDPSLGADNRTWTRSPNLTSHESGLLQSYPTADDWIARFRQGRRVAESPMHWGPFSRMSEDDLAAIYEFLKTVPPADNWVGEVTFVKD